MTKTRLTVGKREAVSRDIEQRLHIGQAQTDAEAAMLVAHKAVSAAVARACPPKELAILSKHNCAKLSTDAEINSPDGMQREVSFWNKRWLPLRGGVSLGAFAGPCRYEFFRSIEVTTEEMTAFVDWESKADAWQEARARVLSDFAAVIASAKTVEDLEGVLPLDAAYFVKLKRKNTGLIVSNDVLDRVRAATLDPKS